MPRTRLTQHGMDVVFKLEAQQLGSALARRFGKEAGYGPRSGWTWYSCR